jgi:hypothetical protein
VPEALIDVVFAGREGRAIVMLVFFFFFMWEYYFSMYKNFERYFIVLPRPMPAAPRRCLIVAAR